MQKGNTNILLVIIIVLLVGFGAYYLGKQSSQNTPAYPNNTISSQPTTTTSPSATPSDEITNWKTYTTSKYGTSFKYPVDYQIEVRNDADTQYLLSIKGPSEEYSFEIHPTGQIYSNYPPGTSPQGTKVFNNKTWEYLPAGGFGDAGMTFETPPQYEINTGEYRYNFKMIKPTILSPTLEKIISSFEFTK